MPQQASRRVYFRDAPQNTGPERDPGVGRLVGGEGALVLGPAVDVVEYPAGKTAAGQTAQVFDRRGPRQTTLLQIGMDTAEADNGPERPVGVHESGL